MKVSLFYPYLIERVTRYRILDCSHFEGIVPLSFSFHMTDESLILSRFLNIMWLSGLLQSGNSHPFVLGKFLVSFLYSLFSQLALSGIPTILVLDILNSSFNFLIFSLFSNFFVSGKFPYFFLLSYFSVLPRYIFAVF